LLGSLLNDSQRMSVVRKDTTMSRLSRFSAPILAAVLVAVTLPATATAQRRAVPRQHPPHPERAITVRGHVFIGGYFYDPFFGPYPWWPRSAYPYWYYPVYDARADVRVRVEPKAAEDAAVYVDGFYAGIVDDFNGVFQALPLTPGGHSVVLYLEGFRTVRHNIYLRPGSTFNLRVTMERLAAGATSEPPEVAPPLPPPPPGSYRAPVTSPRALPPAGETSPAPASGFGTLDLSVRPLDADVTIDGQPWVSSEEGHFVVQVPAGRHRVEVRKRGYRQFVAEIQIGDGETSPLNVSLMAGSE
jgi:hypothetical protein